MLKAKMYDMFTIFDDRGRYWEIDFKETPGSDDFIYNGNYMPGDDPTVEILGGRVEVSSLKKTKKKTIKVNSAIVERVFNDLKLGRALRK